jgi:hypothetical protein
MLPQVNGFQLLNYQISQLHNVSFLFPEFAKMARVPLTLAHTSP